jgi:NADH dehydrogenase [ubiquinone] 1 alpha subcomplex assembly factor 7
VTGLLDHLRRHIALEGPISVADYMALALGHPEHGYYMSRDPFGRAGDFVTAPEISQMFGELIGLWSAQVWHDMGKPQSFKWVELGPGRGTLSADALRAMKRVTGLIDALDVHLVETSPLLRERQREAITGLSPSWHDTLAEVPAGPAVVVANEFFDALPVRQFQASSGAWHERLVDIDGRERLRFVLNGAAEGPTSAAEGTIRETCPAGLAVAGAVASRIVSHGGAALVVDYGYDRPGCGDTLQALREHKFHDVLASPGDADLTAHVDFAALSEAARNAGARIHGPVDQGRFLAALGIGTRAAALKRAAPDEADDIDAAVARLTGSAQMGSLFKVLAMTSAGLVPAGFEA